MSVKISGMLRDGMNNPIKNTLLEVAAKRTSSQVVVFAKSSSNTGESGEYSFVLNVGRYSLNVHYEGQTPKYVGDIVVNENSTDGTIEQFLTVPGVNELNPQILAQVIQARADAQAAAEKSAESSRGYGVVYPFFKGLKRNNVEPLREDQLNASLLNWMRFAINDARVIGARANKFYRIEYIAPTNTPESVPGEFTFQISELDKTDYATSDTKTLLFNAVIKIEPFQGIRTYSYTPTTPVPGAGPIQFEFKFDTDFIGLNPGVIFAGSTTISGAYCWIIDPTCYELSVSYADMLNSVGGALNGAGVMLPMVTAGVRNAINPVPELAMTTINAGMLKEAILDIKIIGARIGKYYRVCYLGPADVVSQPNLYTIQIEELDKATYATDDKRNLIHNGSIFLGTERQDKVLSFECNAPPFGAEKIIVQIKLSNSYLLDHPNYILAATTNNTQAYGWIIGEQFYDFRQPTKDYTLSVLDLLSGAEYRTLDFTKLALSAPAVLGQRATRLIGVNDTVNINGNANYACEFSQVGQGVALKGAVGSSIALSADTPIVKKLGAVISFSYKYTDVNSLQRLIWQNTLGAAGNLQIVQNGRFNGAAFSPVAGVFSVSIAGATGGGGTSGNVKSANLNPDEWHLITLVLAPGAQASQLRINGELIDTFTLSALNVANFTLFGVTGTTLPVKGPVFFGRIIGWDSIPTIDILSQIEQWVIGPFKSEGGSGSSSDKYEKYNPVLLKTPLNVPIVSAKALAAMVINDDGSFVQNEVIYVNDATTRIQIASMTKMLTAAIMLDMKPKYNEQMTRTANDANTGSGNNLEVGDIITVRDAVYNLMLPSSNVTANIIGRVFGGKLLEARGVTTYTPAQATAEWVAKMNATAQAIGMTSATFTTPSGLGTNLSNVVDILKLVAYAAQHPLIMKSWRTQEYTIRIAGDNAKLTSITNSNTLLFTEQAVIGGKTGTLSSPTDPAYNVANVALMPDGTLLAVVAMGAQTANDRFTDSKSLIDALLEQYK